MLHALLVALPISVAWHDGSCCGCCQKPEGAALGTKLCRYDTTSLAHDKKVHKNQMSDQTLLSVPLFSIQLIDNIRFSFSLLWADPNVSNGEPLEVVASRRALETGRGSPKRD
jgi:hypothetical protein